jgi:hypothetical protein
MTGSRATARRVVFLDGFAGRGRDNHGSPALAECILRIVQRQGTSGTVSWTCFFVELEDDSAAELDEVVDEYPRASSCPQTGEFGLVGPEDLRVVVALVTLQLGDEPLGAGSGVVDASSQLTTLSRPK